MTNTVYLSGDGKLSLNIPAFDYEELSGIKLNWKGFSGNTDYSQGFKAIVTIILRRLCKSNWPTKAMCLWKTCASNPKRKTA